MTYFVLIYISLILGEAGQLYRFKMSSHYELSALDLCRILAFYTLIYKSSLMMKDINYLP